MSNEVRHGDRKEVDVEGGNRDRPNYPLGIVVLFDGGCSRSTDTNTITPHHSKSVLSLLIQKGSFHGLRVFCA